MISEERPNHVYQFSNVSRVKRMLWIGFYTLILNILTLTFFRFWGRTHFRRQLWSDTSIDGQALEYIGRGKELFIGFLIAIFTVMLPTVGLVFAAQLFFGEELAVLVITLVYIFLLWLAGVAIFLTRRYMVSRTRYRGIRFEQRGSAIDYGWRAFGYGILIGITLGWYAPAARLRLSRYIWENAYFGSENIKFNDTEEALKEPVYGSFALMWFAAVILYFLFFTVVWQLGIVEGVAYDQFDAVIKFYLILFGFGMVFALFRAWYSAVMTRRIIKSLSVSGIQGTCNLSTFKLLSVWLAGMLLTLFTLGVGFMAARMMTWRLIANHTSFGGDFDFEAIEQAASTGPSQGEGIADGLDLGAGF